MCRTYKYYAIRSQTKLVDLTNYPQNYPHQLTRLDTYLSQIQSNFMSEKTILSRLELLASSLGHLLFRQNTGSAWTGKPIKLPSGDMLLKNPRPISFGFKGMGDLIGGTQVKITPDMVGRTVLIFTNYEVKLKNTPTTKEQLNFSNTITKLGGISIIDRFTTTDHVKESTYVESINKFQTTSQPLTSLQRESNN